MSYRNNSGFEVHFTKRILMFINVHIHCCLNAVMEADKSWFNQKKDSKNESFFWLEIACFLAYTLS